MVSSFVVGESCGAQFDGPVNQPTNMASDWSSKASVSSWRGERSFAQNARTPVYSVQYSCSDYGGQRVVVAVLGDELADQIQMFGAATVDRLAQYCLKVARASFPAPPANTCGTA